MKKDRLPKYLQLPNIFKDHRIVARPTPMTVGYDEWPLSNALCIKFYNGHDKYKPELNEYFHMYQCQLNFVMFALQCTWYLLATSQSSKLACMLCL